MTNGSRLAFTRFLSGWLLLLVAASNPGEAASLFNRRAAPGTIIRTPSAIDRLPDGRILAFPAGKPSDRVQILQVAPETLPVGVAQELRVRVRYNLVSASRGTITLGFNIGSPTSFRVVQNRWIGAGQGELELTTTLAAVRWPNGRPLKAYVGLSTDEHPTKRSLLVGDAVVLTCR